MRESVIYQDILQQGKQEGKQEARVEAVPRLLALGLTVEQVAEALSLSAEQVRQLSRASD